MLTEEEKRERHKIAKAKYDRLRTKQYVMRLRIGADADVIKKLDSVPSKTEFIRELVRRDIRESTSESS
jgi:hypothetical protein